jgi:plastocyanin
MGQTRPTAAKAGGTKMKTTGISRLAASLALLAALGSTAATKATTSPTTAQQQAAVAQVKIDNFSFMPQVITVAPGTTVTWVNNDDIPHTVVSTTDVFKSKALDTDDKFSFTFDKPGTYDYNCSIHPKMTAKDVEK